MTAHPGNLGGKPPLGLKEPPPPKKPRKPIPRESKKRKAYLASPEREDGKAHMAKVAMHGCIVPDCGAWPVEVHHEGKPRSDMRVLPICAKHHRREFGPGAYHYSPKAFYAAHGDSKFLLAKVADQLAKQWNDPWKGKQ